MNTLKSRFLAIVSSLLLSCVLFSGHAIAAECEITMTESECEEF